MKNLINTKEIFKDVIGFFKEYHILLIFLVFLIIQLQYLDVIPIWDARWTMKFLYQKMELPFSLNNYNLGTHPAFIYGFLLGFLQWLDFGNMIPIHLLHMFVGSIGIYSFYKIFHFIFGKKYWIESFFTTLIFAIHPLFLAHSIMPNLDFPVTCFFLAMTASIFYRRHALFLVFALFSIFTREAGISLYMVFAVAYAIAFITRKKIKKAEYMNQLILLALPIIAFGLFILYKAGINNKVFWQGTTTHAEPIRILPLFLDYDLTNPRTITNLLQIFVLNFNWIFTLFILLYLFGRYGIELLSFIFNKAFNYPHKPLQINRKAFYILLIVFIANGIVLFNIPTYVNTRYRLPLLPLFLIFGAYCFFVLLQKKRKLRQVTLGLMIPLFFFQNFYGIDKVSNDTFGTFDFGSHKMICMKRIITRQPDCGRDQIIYNLQFTNIISLVRKSIERMTPDAHGNIHIISNVQSNHPHIFANIDLSEKRITLKKENRHLIVKPILYTFDDSRPYAPTNILKDISDSELPKELYYIKFPMYGNEYFEPLRLARRGYKVKERHLIDHNGYSLKLFLLER